jgi:hypothetical protein
MCSTWSAIKTRLSLHHIGESEAASDAAQLIPRDRRRSQTNFEYVFHAGKRINVNSTLILDRTYCSAQSGKWQKSMIVIDS